MRVGLIGHNSVEYVNMLFEIWNSGDSAILIDYDTPPSVVKQILEECEAGCCFAEESLCFLFENPPPFAIKTYSIKNNMPCILPKTIRDIYKPHYDESEAVVMNSSGTTGRCKGISLSHRAISNNADSVIDYMNPTSVKTVYSSGDMISEKVIERARRVFGCPVYNVYGQSECGPRITAQTEECCH